MNSPTAPRSIDPELASLFAELRDESDGLVALDGSQRDAWVSGLMATWRSDVVVSDPADVDDQFIAWCDAQDDPIADELAARAQDLVHGALPIDTTGCWLVEDPTFADSSASAVIGFRHGDESEHCVMVEIDEAGLLADMRLGPAAEDLLPDRQALAEVGSPLRVHENDVAETAAAIADAWSAAHLRADSLVLSEGVLLNQLVVRRRLRGLVPDAALELFTAPTVEPVELHPGMTAEEVAEADARSLESLQRALAAARQMDAPATGVDLDELTTAAATVFHAAAPQVDRQQQESLAFLEWADWLGVVLGAVRAGTGTPMHGDAMVDFINRCPEVTTSISKRDRSYVAYALDVAAGVWTELGLITDGALTAIGRWVLPRAAARAWGGDFDA